MRGRNPGNQRKNRLDRLRDSLQREGIQKGGGKDIVLKWWICLRLIHLTKLL